jgi:glycosyltransferase involved in cell wall biosynthesis
VYKEHGVDPSKLFIVPNGADAELFRYTDQPAYAERSIVVGKIESRKGQYLIQDNQSVWFAGNKGEDDSFDYSNPRWLGEWNKDTLYHNLTDYGNLVLLSDGEADSLVIKEALVAGLGVVVSQWGAANIDAALPFITAIPNDKLQDCAYVDEKIKANREISVTMRSTIREYSKKFHWSTRVADYLNIVKRIL